jgi:hypothetical protein
LCAPTPKKKSRPQGLPPKPRRSNYRKINRAESLAANIRPALPAIATVRLAPHTRRFVCDATRMQQSVLLA